MIGRRHTSDNYYVVYWYANNAVYGAYFRKTAYHKPERVIRTIKNTDRFDKQIQQCLDIEYI